MGYYKNTMYYGNNAAWHYEGCKCSECRYAQMEPRKSKQKEWYRYSVVKDALCAKCNNHYDHLYMTGPYDNEMFCEHCKSLIDKE